MAAVTVVGVCWPANRNFAPDRYWYIMSLVDLI